MSTCPYLNENRCGLAEKLCLTVLAETQVCQTDEQTCRLCQAQCEPNETAPSQICLGLVEPPVVKAHIWREFRKTACTSRNTPQPPSSPRKLKGIVEPERTPCVHRGEVLEQFVCACNGVSTKPMYACTELVQCIEKLAHSERAAEHLRKKHPNKEDKNLRKFGCCETCPIYESRPEQPQP